MTTLVEHVAAHIRHALPDDAEVDDNRLAKAALRGVYEAIHPASHFDIELPDCLFQISSSSEQAQIGIDYAGSRLLRWLGDEAGFEL